MKTLEQIQQENREFVRKATLTEESCDCCEAFGKNWDDLKGWENCEICNPDITLDRTIAALNHLIAKIEPHRLTQFYLIFYRLPDHNELFTWDLTKETLEEQTEETQRAINELLTQTKE